MKREIIKAVKNYSKVMFDKEIKVVENFELENCRISSIVISNDEYELIFYINIEYKSLKNISNILFGYIQEELIVDLQKEIVNTIGGYFADNFYKTNYSLSIPKIEQICDTKNAIFFQNEIIKMSVKLKVK